MSRKSLLVFSILVFSAGALAGTRSANSQPAAPASMADNTFTAATDQPAQTFQVGQMGSFDAGGEDDICYKIRAYIFKRDDDHAPEFVRSTTCGPRKPHTKDAKWPDAKLVPAN